MMTKMTNEISSLMQETFRLQSVWSARVLKPSMNDETAAYLPAPLTSEEIIMEQQTEEYCQNLLAEQVGRKGSCFFEDDDGFLSRQNLR